MTKKNLRSSLNPPLVLTFIVVAITGIMLMFHIEARGIKNLHEWMSIVFLVLCIVHLCINWKTFLVYLKNRAVLASVIGVCLLSALLISGAGDSGRGHHGSSRSGHYKQFNYLP